MDSLDILKENLDKISISTNNAIKTICNNRKNELIDLINNSELRNKKYYINGIVNAESLPSDFFIELEKSKVSSEKELYILRTLSTLGLYDRGKVFNYGFYRRFGRGIKPKIIRYNSFGSEDDITRLVVKIKKGTIPINYILPTSNLFSDFLNEGLYPMANFENKKCHLKINHSHQILESYFGDTKIVEGTLHTIALVGDLKIPHRFSYNCRNTYPGVCFIDIERTTVIDILESIIHESIHQALWPQISISSDGWVPTSQYYEVSTFTNRKIDVSVLIQAAFIYSAYYCIRKTMLDEDRSLQIKFNNLKMINTLMNYTKNYPKSEEILTTARLMLEDKP